jgi:hypothetical protein
LYTPQELRQRIRHLSYGHGRAGVKLKQDADAALHAAAQAESRQRLEDYQEKAALRRLGREQVRVSAFRVQAGDYKEEAALRRLGREPGQGVKVVFAPGCYAGRYTQKVTSAEGFKQQGWRQQILHMPDTLDSAGCSD